jgi:hypothetical protein
MCWRGYLKDPLNLKLNNPWLSWEISCHRKSWRNWYYCFGIKYSTFVLKSKGKSSSCFSQSYSLDKRKEWKLCCSGIKNVIKRSNRWKITQ